MENRYYVQHLTEQVFVVRERMSISGTPGPDDRIVRSFDVLHDAYMYVSSLNEAQNTSPDAAAPGSRTLPKP